MIRQRQNPIFLAILLCFLVFLGTFLNPSFAVSNGFAQQTRLFKRSAAPAAQQEPDQQQAAEEQESPLLEANSDSEASLTANAATDDPVANAVSQALDIDEPLDEPRRKLGEEQVRELQATAPRTVDPGLLQEKVSGLNVAEELIKQPAVQSPLSESESLPYNIDQVVEIKFAGNRLVLNDELYDVLGSRVGEDFDREKVKADLFGIYSMGYFDREALEVKPTKTDKGVVLTYKVKENVPVTGVEIYGNEAIRDIDVYKIFMDMVGKPENVNAIAEKIKELETAYAAKGYILARVEDIDLEGDGTLKIYVDEGTLTEVRYVGNVKTKASYLDHLMRNTKTNEAYNDFNFLKDFERVKGTGYFSEISRSVKPHPAGEGYLLTVDLHEKRTINIGLGGGVNTQSGLFGNVGLTAGNIKGKGESFTVNGVAGSGFGSNNTFNSNSRLFRRRRLYTLNTRYSIPYYKDTQNTVGYTANFLDGPSFILDLANQRKLGTGADLSRAVSKHGVVKAGISLNYLRLRNRNDDEYENFLTGAILEDQGFTVDDKFDDDLDDYRRSLRQNNGLNRRQANRRVDAAFEEAEDSREEQLEDGLYSSLTGTYLFNSLDNQRKPRSGWKNSASLEPSASFGDFDSFVKASASAAKFFPLPKQSTFVVHGRVGYDLFDNMPDFAQFRLGGVRGVRGYRPFSELGVGNRLGIGSAELRTPLYNIVPYSKKIKFLKDVDLAFFADAGVVGGNNRLNNLSERLNRAISIGVGVRVNLPLVGGVRVDFGFPLIDAIANDRLFRMNFSVAERF